MHDQSVFQIISDAQSGILKTNLKHNTQKAWIKLFILIHYQYLHAKVVEIFKASQYVVFYSLDTFDFFNLNRYAVGLQENWIQNIYSASDRVNSLIPIPLLTVLGQFMQSNFVPPSKNLIQPITKLLWRMSGKNFSP